MNPALSFPPEMTALLPACGGNLARVISNALSSQTGHLLFQITQRVEKLLREHGSGGQVSSFVLTTARAAQIGACRNAAKSLLLPPHNTVLADLFHAY